MSRYHLSEAYSNLYNPRLQENFDDNLQFIDYMLDEDIEEVVESLFWEFRDYGNSVDEAIDLLMTIADPEIIQESYQSIYEEYLQEEMTPRQEYEKRTKSQQKAGELGKALRNPTAANYVLRKGGVGNAAKAIAGDAFNRLSNRSSRIRSGVVKRVKQAWEGAKGGLGRAKATMKAAPGNASKFVSAERESGKAKLQSFMRKVKGKLERTKRNITGETNRTNDLKRKQYGAKKAANSAANRATQADAFETKTKKSEPPVRSTIGNVPPPQSKSPSSSGTLALPPARRTREERIAANRARNAANTPSGGGAIGPRGTSSATSTGGVRKPSAALSTLMRAANTKEERERVMASYRDLRKQAANTLRETTGLSYTDSFSLTDIIINDLISEGYAQDEYDAVNLIMTLNEDTIHDIAQEYLCD